ncbi:MAG: prepilin-type N-terminal cleavage/methylation domain-containing protein [Rubripirellula sp.]
MRRQSYCGVTMIEVMVSLVLVSTILLVSLSASANLLRNDVQQRNSTDGKILAQRLMDEVSAMEFEDTSEPIFGLETGESGSNRSAFDDVDDYHGYTMSPPTYRDGTTINGFTTWSVSITVTPVEPDATGVTTAAANANSPLRLIVVTCTTPDGSTVDASTLISNVPSSLPVNSPYDRWRRTKLTFEDGREIQVSAPLRNQPTPSP